MISGLRLDRYVLRLLAGPFALSLSCLLVGLLLDRLLRLFQAVANAGADFSTTLLMAADLVPHYLQLALPAAFFASIFFAVARLGDDNELDAMLAAGRSIGQISRPYFLVSILLSVLSFYFYGFLQPYARYAYHQELYQAVHAGWNARVQGNTFIDVGRGVTLTADAVDPTGRELQRVFLQQKADGGGKLTITAQQGILVPSANGRELQLRLEHGRMLREWPDGRVDVDDFARGRVNDQFSPNLAPFRPRGDAVKEVTLPELYQQMHESAPAIPRPTLAAAFQARLARIFLLPLLPLLGVPLGMASKRGRRMPGVVFAVLAVLSVHHALKFGQSVAATGHLPAVLAVWTPYALFALLSAWLFRQSLLRPGDNPVSNAVATIENLIERAHRRTGKVKAAS